MTLGSVLLSPRRARAWPQCPKCPGRSGELQREECTPPPPMDPLGPDLQTLASRRPHFPTKWAGKSPHLVAAFPRGRSPEVLATLPALGARAWTG